MNDTLPVSISFPPIADDDALILILGSMPSIKSLEQQQYYAHPRNAFWPIMNRLFEITENLDYSQRCNQLIKNKIAVWDVLKTCQRRGSLDQHIDPATIITNDFNKFFEQHPTIQKIFFNGSKAEQVFNQYVLPTLNSSIQLLARHRLPSTSPAHAAMKFEQKLEDWQQIIAEI